MSTVTRAVVIPVAAPVSVVRNRESFGLTWAELDDALRPAFRASTDLANWCVRRLFVLDDPASTKAPAVVKTWYGYKDAQASYPKASEWAGAAGSMSEVTRSAHRKYLQLRFDAVVRNVSSLLTYRFPQPFAVRAQELNIELSDSGDPLVTVPLPDFGRVTLRLRRGHEFARQYCDFRQLVEGGAKKCAGAIDRDRKGRLRVKVVGEFPRRERGPAVNTAFVHTDPAALLVCEINGHRVTVTNGDHLKRWQAAHRAYLQRTSEDCKREVRMDKRQRKNLNTARELRCNKHHNRIDTAIEQVAAQVARMCERKGVGLVAYDDADKSFFPEGFPWHALKTRLCRVFVGEMGGEWIDGSFVHLNTDEEKQEWLSRARHTAQAGKRAMAHSNRSDSHPAVTPNSPPKRSPAAKTKRKSVR